MAAERLHDGARAVFDCDYVRENLILGYAVTVHSAQGVTTDTAHAVLGETTSRSLFYVAMTRGRNTTPPTSMSARPNPTPGQPMRSVVCSLRCGGPPTTCSEVVGAVLARADRPATAHQVADQTHRELLPDIVARLVNRQRTAAEQ